MWKACAKKLKKGELLFGNMDTWLIWNLTGEHVTDVTNASRTMLMDFKTLQWDAEICSLMGIPIQMLPQICSSSRGVRADAKSGPSVASSRWRVTWATSRLPLVGQTCFEVGRSQEYLRHWLFHADEHRRADGAFKEWLAHHALLSSSSMNNRVYALEGSIAITGALVQWLRDNLKMISTSAEMEDLAKTVEDNGGFILCRRFPVCSPPTGVRMRAAPSWD